MTRIVLAQRITRTPTTELVRKLSTSAPPQMPKLNEKISDEARGATSQSSSKNNREKGATNLMIPRGQLRRPR